MKTIKTILLLAMILIMLITSSCGYSAKGRTILINAADEKASPELMQKSASVLSARLKTYGLGNFTMKVSEKKARIEITVPDSCDVDLIDSLLTQKGQLTVYEICDRKLADSLFKIIDVSPLLSSGVNASDNVSRQEISAINVILKGQQDNTDVLFRWGLTGKRSQIRLFALKKPGNPILTESDFSAVSYSDNGIISFTLKKEAAERWKDATSRNIGKGIAISADDIVIADPVVRQIIDSGNFEVSGKFTYKEGRYITALIANGALPLKFIVAGQ